MNQLGVTFPSRFEQLEVSRGSTDMGNVTQIVPGIHPVVSLEKNLSFEIHTQEFEKIAGKDESVDAMIRASKGITAVAIEIIISKLKLK